MWRFERPPAQPTRPARPGTRTGMRNIWLHCYLAVKSSRTSTSITYPPLGLGRAGAFGDRNIRGVGGERDPAPPGIGKDAHRIGVAVKAARAGYSVLFDTAQ